MGSVFVQKQAWPLVVITYPPSELTERDMDEYLSQLDAILQREEPYALVTDTSSAVGSLSARQLGRTVAWLKSRAGAIGRLSCGNAIVVRPSPLLEGMLNTLYRITRPPNPQRVFSSFDEGVSWGLDRLVATGVLTRKEALERRRLVSIASKPGSKHGAPPAEKVDGTTPGQLGPIIDMFEEPAFLLNSDGSVVHANPAAAKTFPVTPDWLPMSVSTVSTPLKKLCRISLVEVEDGFSYLVIPNRELIPPPEMDPRLQVQLSPSLNRVATMLAQGLSDKEIAVELDRSLATVRTYVTRIFRKLDVHSRAELICLWSARARWEETAQ